MALTSFSIENFRVFKDKTSFGIAPITILTGTNSSGKSSLIKGMNLVRDNLAKATGVFPLNLNFSQKDNYLGGFSNVLNDSNNKVISFEYPLDDFTHIFHYQGGAYEINLNRCIVKAEYVVNSGFEEEGRLNHLTVSRSGKNLLELKPSDNKDEFLLHININVFITSFEKALQIDDFKKYPLFEFNYFNEIDKRDEREDNKEFTKLQWEKIIEFYHTLTIKRSEIEQDSLQNAIDFDSCLEHFVTFHAYFKNKIEYWPEDVSLLYTPTLKVIINLIQDFINGLKGSLSFDYHHLPPVRGVIRRLYNNADESPISLAAVDYMRVYSELDEKASCFVDEWISEFEIGEKIDLQKREGATGIYLQKGGQNILLADLGFGITQFLPILFKIAISHADDSRLVIIEEPEANLHPKFQSQLADLFVDAYQKLGVRFILETHSEYLIRKIQYLVADKTQEFSTNDVVIYYFHKPDKIPPNEPQVKKITINPNGELSYVFGPGFYDEATTLKFNLLKINSSQKN